MDIAKEKYSVTRLTRVIRNLLEDSLPSVWVEGEISNYTHHRSGHRYFTLKDEKAQLPCVFWRTRPEPGFGVENGAQALVFGRISVYEQGGRYQLDVQSILPIGIGSLREAYEALKLQLQNEGLFDLDRKRSLPRFPAAIGLVTSPSGAAIRDLVWSFKKRFPPSELFLIPVSVQGDSSSEEISQAIETFNITNLVDVIVVGRGGGSLEDLWAFNEERTVRAIVASEIPIVSAVGHEIDVTLCDLAADIRAPTPTAAAAYAVPDSQELKTTFEERSASMIRALNRQIGNLRSNLHNTSRSYGFKRVITRVGDERMRLSDIERDIDKDVGRMLMSVRERLDNTRHRLQALSPEHVLQRGYSIIRNLDGSVVKRADELAVDSDIEMKFYKGKARATVIEITNE